MGNIEDSSKTSLPAKKATSNREIKPALPKKQYRTDIVNAIHSSKLNCKVEFHKFRPIVLEGEPPEDDLPEEEWTLGGA
jgi:hypothetical protein